MKLYLGSDHAGYELKEAIKKKLKVSDLTPLFDPADDYPDAAAKVARAVAKQKAKGVLICGNGAGVCIAANKIKGIRAVVVQNNAMAKLARLHDDANIICMAGGKQKDPIARKATKTTTSAEAVHFIKTWLNTKPSMEERHIRRRKKIAALER